MWDILVREDLVRIWLYAGGSKPRFAYGLGKAKNQQFIHSLGWGIFRVPRDDDRDDTSGRATHIESQYWTVLFALIREHAPSGAIIAHEKSIELHMKNYEVPDVIVLYTRDIAKRVKIGDFEFHFRTLQSGEKSQWKNMYRILSEHASEINIESMIFHTLSIDASLLDVASLKRHDTWIAESIVLRFIRKYEKSFSRENLWKLVEYRYIRAINRIRSISKEQGYQRLYEITLDIIKKEGGWCYIHL